MTFGENLKKYRKLKAFTQAELAEKSGIKLGHISKLERDETDPKLSTITKLISALEISSDLLIPSDESNDLNGLLKSRFLNVSKLHPMDIEKVLYLIDAFTSQQELIYQYANKKDIFPGALDNVIAEDQIIKEAVEIATEEHYKELKKSLSK